MDEVRQDEEMLPVDPALVVSVAKAELELLRAEVAISQVHVAACVPVGPPDSVIQDLSPFGQRRF